MASLRWSFVLLLFATAGILGLAGCGSQSGTTSSTSASSAASSSSTSTTPSSVAIYPASSSAPVNGKVQFTAYAASAPGSTFTWSVSGGGSITASGLFTAPASPATITVTASTSGSTGLTGTAALNVTASQGVLVSPSAVAIAAGATQSFTAAVNGAPVTATWEVNGQVGGDGLHGLIDANGNYSAPASPPPGGTTTITAITGSGSSTVSGTATVAVLFSNSSLDGAYAFSYKGNNSSGFTAVAGSFTAQGSLGSTGQIFGGVEDTLVAGSTSASHTTFTGNFSVNPDGTASATLSNNTTWEFTLVSNPVGGAVRQALLVRFDSTSAGSGTINAQNQGLLTASAFSGNYVFALSGVDSAGNPMDIAGRFYADGVGTIPPGSAVQDINDNGTSTYSAISGTTTSTSTSTTSVTGADTTLHGSFLMDATAPSSGRGTLTLASTDTTIFTTGGVTLQFAFYIVDNTHLKLVEIDKTESLAGDIYGYNGPSPEVAAEGEFTTGSALPAGSYAFTVSGISTNGAYALGGIFATTAIASSTSGSLSGVVDINTGIANILLNAQITGTSFTIDPNYGRITIPLRVNNVTRNFVGYTAYYNSQTGPVEFVELIEVDGNTIATGIAYPQSSSGALQGNYALNLQGVSGPKNGALEQDVVGQVTASGTTSLNGILYINNYALATLTPHSPLNSSTTVVSPTENGRGTATIATSAATYSLAYYILSSNSALLLEVDGARVTTGVMSGQF
jgi:hypothetical protein